MVIDDLDIRSIGVLQTIGQGGSILYRVEINTMIQLDFVGEGGDLSSAVKAALGCYRSDLARARIINRQVVKGGYKVTARGDAGVRYCINSSEALAIIVALAMASELS